MDLSAGTHIHPAEVQVLTAGYTVIRMIFLPLAIKTVQNVVGVEISRRGKVLVGVPLYAFTQVEGIYGTVIRDAPRLGQTGNNLGRTGLEFG